MVASNTRTRVLPAGLMATMLLVASTVALLGVAAPGAAAAPAADVAVYRDLDADGFLDAVDIAFATDAHPSTGIPIGIKDSTIRPGDFIIEHLTTKIVPYAAHTNVDDYSTWGQTGNGCRLTQSDDTCFRLFFRENVLLTSADTPKISYNAGTATVPEGKLTDVNGQAAASFTFEAAAGNTVDGVGPALWGASAVPGDNRITLTFSEGVPVGAIAASKMCFTDSGNNKIVPQSVETDGSRRAFLNLPAGVTVASADLGSTPAKVAAHPCGSPNGGSIGGSTIGPAITSPKPVNLAWNGKDGHVKLVNGEVGSKIIYVHFTAGVGSISNGVVKAEHFSIRTNSGTLTGIDVVRHIPGSPWAELVAKESLTASDLAPSSGAQVRVNSGSIVAYGDTNNVIPSQLHNLLDKNAPQIAKIRTVDANRNGLLDAVRIDFTEQIDDVVAGLGTTAAVGSWKMHVGLTEVTINEVITGGQGQTTCRTDKKADQSPNQPNDHTIFLCFSEGVLKTDGTCTTGTGLCLHTGVRPAISYTDPPSGAHVQDRSTEQNRLASFQMYIADDNAQPQLMEACTRDNDGNGLLDGYNFRFSEPMDDASLLDAHWQIGETAAPRELSAFTHGPTNDNLATLPFAQDDEKANEGDTGTLPNVYYTKPVDPGQWVKDAHGLELGSLGKDDVKERDCARPVLLRVEAFPDTKEEDPNDAPDEVKVFFSEGVRAAVGGGRVTKDHFQFHNPNGGGASGFLSATHNVNESTVLLKLNDDISESDLSLDRISAGGPDQFGKLDAAISQARLDPFLIVDSTRQVKFSASSEDRTGPGAPGPITVSDGSKVGTTAKLSFGAVNDPSGINSYEVRFHTAALTTSCFQDGTGTKQTFTTGIKTSGTMTVEVTGLTGETEYHFCVRAVDGANNAGFARVTDASSPYKTPKAVVTTPTNEAPAKIASLTKANVNANSGAVTFTPPTDDSTSASKMKYNVRISSTAFTSWDGKASQTDAGILVVPSTTSTKATLNFNGLAPETKYYVSVAAKDEEGATGPASEIITFTTTKDTTPPSDAPVITWAGHTSGEKTTDRRPSFTWTEVQDPQSTVTYYWKVTTDASYKIDGKETDSTTETRASPPNVGTGMSYFHLAAASAGGVGPQATFELNIVDSLGPSDEEMSQANKQIQSTVTAKRTDGNTVVSWTVPASVKDDVEGLQVWCGDGTTFEVVRDISKTTNPTLYAAGSYTVMTPCKGGQYVVTTYYASDLGKSQSSSDVPGFEPSAAAVVPDEGSAFPLWLIIVLAVAGALIILVVVLMLVLKGKGKGGATMAQQQGDGWGEVQDDEPSFGAVDEPGYDDGQDDMPYADEPDDMPYADEPDDIPYADEAAAGAAGGAMAEMSSNDGGDADDDATLHHVTCPECQDTFVAEGHKPLKIECPNCGVQGMLS